VTVGAGSVVCLRSACVVLGVTDAVLKEAQAVRVVLLAIETDLPPEKVDTGLWILPLPVRE
jgi:hypothetical protein